MEPTNKAIMEAIKRLEQILSEMNKERFAEQYLDNEEFCKFFKISAKTAQLWRDSDQLPYAIFGKKIYYKNKDIDMMFDKEFKRPKYLKRKGIPPRKRPGSSKNNGWNIDV